MVSPKNKTEKKNRNVHHVRFGKISPLFVEFLGRKEKGLNVYDIRLGYWSERYGMIWDILETSHGTIYSRNILMKCPIRIPLGCCFWRHIWEPHCWLLQRRNIGSHLGVIFASHIADCCSGVILDAIFGSRIAGCCSGAIIRSRIAGCSRGAILDAILGAILLGHILVIIIAIMTPKCNSQIWLSILLSILLRCSSQQCGSQTWLPIWLQILRRCSSQQCGSQMCLRCSS